MYAVLCIPKGRERLAEELLKKDEKLSKLSITIRSASSLELEGEDFFFLLEGDETLVAGARRKLAEVTKDIPKDLEEKVRKKIQEQEEKSIEGLGFLMK